MAIPTAAKPSGAAADLLLWTVQARYTPQADETFVEQALRINTAEGLGSAGNLIQTWNPLTDALTIHRARILRSGRTLDLLAGGKTFAVLRRESNLEAAMIDGELTATLQPEGLQVGDVMDFAYTVKHREPALAGRSEATMTTVHAGAVERMIVRASWPSAISMRSWRTDDMSAPTLTTRDGWTQASLDLSGQLTPDPPSDAPLRDQLRGMMQFSGFKSWTELSAVAAPLYDRAAALQHASPLTAEIVRIAARETGAKARTLAALQLVEQQVRYLYVGLDAGGYTPATADLTWTRRFGDCKGKTVLLLALLRGLGVQAEPVLVSVQAGDGLDRRLPQMGAFDHVIVRATIDGRGYWLDATRQGDVNLDLPPVPNYHWALPVRTAGTELEPLNPSPPVLPQAEKMLTVDARPGIDKPAAAHLEYVLRNDYALVYAQAVNQLSAADRDRALRKTLVADDGWIKADHVAFTYDPAQGIARATLDGSGQLPFTTTGDARDWAMDASSLGRSADLKRRTPYHADAPFAVAYPVFVRSTIQVLLPDGGRGFSVINDEAVAKTVGGVAYARAAAVVGDRMTMVASTKALAQEFPAADAPAVETALRELYGYDVVLRHAPTKAATTTTAPPSAAEAALTVGAPSDPLRRAVLEFGNKDFVAAIDDFGKAIAQGPQTAKLYYDRGAARLALGRVAPARTDFEAALRLDPRDALALYALGRLDLAAGDGAGADRRFADARVAARDPLEMERLISIANQLAGRFLQAVPFFDRSLALEQRPERRAILLNERCWMRAQAGKQLELALKDCDESLRMSPGVSATLDSRGLVQLRLKAYARAIADYDAALILRKGLPTSLYGRGVAELRSGRKAAADADLAAARALDAKVDDVFARGGVKP